MISIKAHFDGKAIIPEEPVDLPTGRLLLVDVREAMPSDTQPAGSAMDWLIENAIEDDDLPPDLSHQHDHFLYGSPKKKD